MTMADVIVEIGFSGPETGTYLHLDDPVRGLLDTGTLAPDDLWTDVSEWVQSGSTRRGATRADGPTLRYEAGTATIVLRNDDRRFDPTNLSGPYVSGGVSQVAPMRAVRIRVTWGGVTYAVWRGFADNWQVAYQGPHASVVTLTATDAFKVFASYDRGAVAAVGGGEDTGARINRILDSVNWPDGDRIIDTGNITVQATTLADNTLSEMLLTADTELGELYMDAQGHVVFRRRLGIQEDSRSVNALACFGTQPSGEPTTVNLASNPSIQTDTLGWVAVGSVAPTISRSSVRALFGTHSLLATWGTGGLFPGVGYDVSGLVVGRVYTISAYVWVPTGSPAVVPIVAATGQFGDAASTLNDQWERLTWTGAAIDTTLSFQLWPMVSPTAGQQVWIDGLQVEEGGAATAYVDGDQAGGEWDGVAHASTSRRLPELPYADAQITYDDQSIYNRITIGRSGGTEQTAESTASRTAYLTRTYGRSDLLMQTDGEALRHAEQLVTRHAMPELRFSTLELNPRMVGFEDALYAQALGREIGDRIRVIHRPPGGGDPIQRDAWVRGVEHQFGRELAWRTTFVLQQAPDRDDIVDTFTRVGASGWGTSNSGDLWTPTSGVLGDFSTDGTFGLITFSALNAERHVVADLGHTDQDVLTWLTLPVTPTGAGINWGVLLRYVDLNNYYWADVQVPVGGGALTLRLIKRVAGVATQITTAVSATTHSTTVPRILRTHIAGSHFAAKVWSSSASEPTGWEVQTTDTALTTGTKVGAIARLMTGNTNGSVQFKFHNYFAENVYAWD